MRTTTLLTATSSSLALILSLGLTATADAQEAPEAGAEAFGSGIAQTDSTSGADSASGADSGPVGQLRLGKIYSFGGGADLQHGFGLDLRYHVFPERDMDGFIGVFGQGQYELGDAWRMAGGVSFGWDFFGLELGVSHRTETSVMAGSTGLHIGQAFTYGPVSIGGRVTIPLYDHVTQGTSMGVQGIEGALTLRLAFGFTVHGQRRSSGCHGGGHGRGGGHGHGHGHGR